MSRLRKFLFFFLTVAAIFLISPKIVFAQNLLQNSGFEEGDLGWNKYGSTELNMVENALNDSKAGALTSDKTGMKYIYQEFDVFEGEEFQLSGWVNWNDDFISNAKLRVEWYDESLTTRVGLDEISLSSRDEEWQYLAGNVKAPPSSKKAKFEAYGYLNEANPADPVLFDDLFFGSIDQEGPNPTSTPTSSPTSALTPTSPSTLTLTPTSLPPSTSTPSPSPTKATYRINEVKDEDGSVVSSVKIYVDGVYIHHYAPETITFCDGCQCDSYVNCGFGQHTIKLEKSGYQDWSETINIQAGNFLEANPVINFSSSTSAPTQTPTTTPTATKTPTPAKTPTPTKKPTSNLYLTPTPKLTAKKEASSSGDILGKEATTAVELIKFPKSESASPSMTPSPKFEKRIGRAFLLSGGVLIIMAGAFLFKKKYFKKGVIKLPR